MCVVHMCVSVSECCAYVGCTHVSSYDYVNVYMHARVCNELRYVSHLTNTDGPPSAKIQETNAFW